MCVLDKCLCCLFFQCDNNSTCNKKQVPHNSQSCNGPYISHHDCADHNSNTTLASMESCRSCDPRSPRKPLQLGSRNSDNGYSSGADGCENCSMPSSNDSSDIVCSDGVCNGNCGKYTIISL